MSDLLILVGTVAFAFGTPAVLLYLAWGEGHGVTRAGDGGDSSESDATDETVGDEAATDTNQHTVGQFRRGRK